MSEKKESLFKQKLKQSRIDKSAVEKISEKRSQQIQSFPKVFKIDKFDIKNYPESKTVDKEKIENTSLPMIDQLFEQNISFGEMTYLNQHKQGLNDVISQDELNQINNENWKTVDSMNEEERKNYINLIQNTLPAHFIEKLRKKTKITQNQQATQLTVTESAISPETTKIEAAQTKTMTEHKKMNQVKIQKETPLQVQDDAQNHREIMANIRLNIKTGRLSYVHQNVQMTLTEEQKETLVNKGKIYEMVTSDNNQSQIIGAQLLLDWIKNIFPIRNVVFFINQIPFHSRIMIAEIYTLLKAIETNLKSTKFYSCYVELLVKAVQILTLISNSLSDCQLDEQLRFTETQFQKAQKSLKDFINSNPHKERKEKVEENHQKQSKQLLFESLAILYQSLKEEKVSRSESLKNSGDMAEIQEKFEKIKLFSKINDLIEAILIQQTFKKEDFEKYALNPSINSFLQTITNFWSAKIDENLSNLSQKLHQAHQFYDLLYKVVCGFDKKKRGFPFYAQLIKKIFTGLLGVLESKYLKEVLEEILSEKFSDKSNSKKTKSFIMLKSSIIFKILFIFRELSQNTEKLAEILESEKSNWIMSEEDSCIIVYINFTHYLQAHDLGPQEIEILQKMFQWIKSQIKNRSNKQSFCFLDSEQTLISLLGLLLSTEQEVYSLIDQVLLNDVFRLAVEFYESEREKNKSDSVLAHMQILSEQQIKQMIQNYNYNSFGNDIFTKLIFWVAVSINPQIEALIAEEVMMRYPMLFYYAFQPQTSLDSSNPNSSQIQIPSNSNSLLGKSNQQIRTNSNSKQEHFTYKSNEQIKASLLKLLFMSLDFSELKGIDQDSLQKIVGSQILQQTRGFQIKKDKINENNCFFKYLIQPFLIFREYKELF